jgi:DNA polymerase III alpha subunit
MLDKHQRYQSDENTGMEMLYHSADINKVEFLNTNDITKFNAFAEELGIKKLEILGDDDFDRINTYIIPQHYKELDVESYVRQLIPNGVDGTDNAATSQRVEMELALYKEQGLIPILQVLIYVVDTLRKNNLVWGVGRGSSVASYILYLIGIHKVDSLKYNLDIKEFLKR